MESNVPGPTFSAAEAAAACHQGSLPVAAQRGLALFNQGRYFDAHEELELAWQAEHGLVRELYRGILQIAVAYYHLLRGNYIGTIKMFTRAQRWLAPYPDRCYGIDVARLRQDARQVEAEVLQLGPNRIAEFDARHLPPLHYDSPNQLTLD